MTDKDKGKANAVIVPLPAARLPSQPREMWRLPRDHLDALSRQLALVVGGSRGAPVAALEDIANALDELAREATAAAPNVKTAEKALKIAAELNGLAERLKEASGAIEEIVAEVLTIVARAKRL